MSKMSNLGSITRRGFLRASGVAISGAALTACSFRPPALASNTTAAAAVADSGEAPITNADDALNRLMAGNQRYIGNKSTSINESEARRVEVSKGQHPFATIFSCVDSRVPPELVFDRGLGDLFVIRTAGHVIDSAVLGSLEYGVAELNIPLLVVMGHEKCGAVKATIEMTEKKEAAPSDINWLVEGIRPAVEKSEHDGASGDALLGGAIKTNVALTVERLKNTPILSEAVRNGKLKIVGALYHLESGAVEITTA